MRLPERTDGAARARTSTASTQHPRRRAPAAPPSRCITPDCTGQQIHLLDPAASSARVSTEGIARVNVALPTWVKRHACGLMSRFPVERGDIRGRECRSLRPGSHKCPVAHVAPDGLVGRHALAPLVARGDWVERHCRRCVSHCTRARGDTFARACRSSRAHRATCRGRNVAPRADRSDMLAWACRSARASGVTCSRGHVAPDAREVRHASGCAASPERSCKATFTLFLVAPRGWVERHAAAPWATCTRENVAFGSQATGPRPCMKAYEMGVGVWTIRRGTEGLVMLKALGPQSTSDSGPSR